MSNNKIMRSSFLYLGPEQLPADFMADKKLDYRLSRYCLQELTGASNLHIIDHLHLENQPTKLVSITHTKNLAACALSVNENVKSVGIDIEWTSRSIREGSHKYFVTHKDELILHTPLEIWCIKEAAFKAYSPLYDEVEAGKVLVLTDFKISKLGYIEGPSASRLTYQIKEEQYQGDKFLIALCEY